MYNIQFNKKWHSFSHNGKRLTSISKFISQFIEPFDSDGIAEKYALKHNTTKEEVLQMWKLKGEKSARKGTEVHQYIEDILLIGESETNSHLITAKEYSSIYAKLQMILQNYDIVGIEGAVGDPELGIAGIFDCLLKSKATGEYLLIDWKTNNKITLDNPFQTFKYPLNYLDQSDINKFSLQLTLLKHCIEKDFQIEVNHMKLVHINLDISEHEIQPMKKELSRVFTHIKNMKDQSK